jgi:hypothetical protein
MQEKLYTVCAKKMFQNACHNKATIVGISESDITYKHPLNYL